MNNFEEWLKEEIKKKFTSINFDDSGKTTIEFKMGDLLELAHAIREKVLREAIEALPTLKPVELEDGEDSYGNTHFNHGVQMSENALTLLLTKE